MCTRSKPPLVCVSLCCLITVPGLSTDITISQYYLPWKLTSEERSRIQEQLEDAGAIIERERAEFDRQRAREERDERRKRESQANEPTNTDNPNPITTGNGDPDTAMGDDDDTRDDQSSVTPSNGKNENTNVSVPGRDHERRRSDVISHDTGDFVIEAGEDTVIY